MDEGEVQFSHEREVSGPEEVILLLKPGAKGQEERLRTFFEEHGLTVEDRQKQLFDRQKLQEFYPHREEYLDQMEAHFSAEPTVALLVKGPKALALCLRLKRHVRGILKLRPPGDGLHSSDSASDAEREKRVLGFE